MLGTNNRRIYISAFVNPEVDSDREVKQETFTRRKLDMLQPLRQRLDSWEIQDPKLARLIAKTIPAQCPFERDLILCGRKIAHIPPMCKLNPLYDQLVGLRFRALCYLADVCGEDIQSYC
ncbi:MAG: Mo-dependent nitrogenase C-terminal domain-containing protein [Scytonema sp. PMC 1069.18]|nr:Mo-dependent nitrogenase C-terminal domain-containing protein [Scytonema sp. PMC 1069.18]MEC4882962.1 Mo-dependent nitrogenase C-terminal domain-containing protein [Scytonema sp. PMC 1070.18]